LEEWRQRKDKERSKRTGPAVVTHSRYKLLFMPTTVTVVVLCIVCREPYARLDIVVSDYFVVFWLWFDVSNDLGCVAMILCVWP